MTVAVGGDTDGEPTAARRSIRPGVAVAVGTVGALTWLGGHVGFFGGVALLAVLLASTPRYAFAVGQVALVAATGGAVPAPAGVVIAEVLLFGVLVSPDAGRSFEPTLTAGTVAAAAGLCGIAWASLAAWGQTWLAGGVVLAVAGLVAYGLHRYELVAQGHVPASGGMGGAGP